MASITRTQAKLIRRLKRRKRRDEESLFLVEGVRLVEDLLASRTWVDLVVTAPALEDTERGRQLSARLRHGDWPTAEATNAELARLSDTEAPQGVLAVARRPDRRLTDCPATARAFLVLDGVSDPGNLGTLLRVAEGLGVDWVIILPGTVDPWNPKAVRASAGSIFRIPVSREVWEDAAIWLRRRGVPILMADAEAEPVSARWEAFALVLGSEAHGISQEVRRDADAGVAIRLRERVDSLNVAVAGALLLDRLLCGRTGEPPN